MTKIDKNQSWRKSGHGIQQSDYNTRHFCLKYVYSSAPLIRKTPIKGYSSYQARFSQWLWNWELTSHLGQYIWELYWPESKLTKSDINWKKVMKSIMNDITCLFSWIKKYESLSLELLQFVLLILITPLLFIFTQPLVIYWYM